MLQYIAIFVKITWAIFLSAVLGVALWASAVQGDWFGIFGGMPDLKELENPKNDLASEVYSADGKLMGKFFREDRSSIVYDSISKNLLDALLATEDVRFFEHSGIDFKATLAVPYYIIKRDSRGSSTITQQLAKNLFKTREIGHKGAIYDVPLFGKAAIKTKEWILAIHLERSYTKKEIAQMYLTTVDFGRNAFGIKTAAKRYYNTTPDKLDLQQSAMLVGMLKAPTRYNPTIAGHEDLAMMRRNTVLEQMVKYGFIDQNLAEETKKLGFGINMQDEDHNTGIGTYFRMAVRENIQKWCNANGYDLFGDGLKVYTTVDSRMQKHAEDAVNEHMKELQKEFFKEWKGRNPWVDRNYREIPDYIQKSMQKTARYKELKRSYGVDTLAINKIMNTPIPMKIFTWNNANFEKDTVLSPVDSIRYHKYFLHTGLMSMDPKTGQVKAWVGGINHKYFQFDNVKEPRQPGSTFKAFVYAKAMEQQGFTPCDQVTDSPVDFKLHDGNVWIAKNSEGYYTNERMTLRRAFAKSINTIAAFLTKKVGAPNIAKLATLMGITTPLDPVPALCLGSSDVSVFDMTGAYSTFVNQGVWIEPHFISHITDKDGKVIYRKQPKTKQTLSERTAYLMVYMLRGGAEESGGTSLGLWRYEFRKNNQVAGKTGTTSSQTDGWYMGMTKDLVTGVRVSGEDPAIRFRSMAFGQGARAAMPAFALYMEKLFKDSTLAQYNVKGDFPKPEGIEKEIEFDCAKYKYNPVKIDSTMYVLPSAAQSGNWD